VRILLVRLRPIGDVVFTTPLISALRRQHPDARLTYLVEAPAAPVLRENPDIDDLRILPKSRGLSRVAEDLSIAARLHADRFDLAIDLHGGPRSAWLTWASRARTRIGYSIKGRAWMYTHVVSRPKELTARHSVLNQWDLLVPLDVPFGNPTDDPVRMTASPASETRIDQHLTALGISPEHRLIVIHVSASNRFKRWPEASFVSVVVELVRADEARRVLLTSGPSDIAAARRVAAQARGQLGPMANAVVDLGPDDTLDLADLRALIARSAAYIGGDSGPLHIAATTTVPIVGLLGPTLEGRSRPWRDPRWFTEMLDAGDLPCRPCRERTCEPGDFRCLTRIGPERVVAAAERALRASSGSRPPEAASTPKTGNERRIPLVQA